MAQKSFYVLFGHGSPLTKRTLTSVPDNGTMIKMIPGTCTPRRAIDITEIVMRVPTTTPAELVGELNKIKSKEHHPAFRIYEPMTSYSESQIANEGTTLHHYVFDAKHVSIYDITDRLHESIKHNPGYIPLSSVNRYLALLDEPYILVVLSCMQVDPDTDAFVHEQLTLGDLTIEEVHEILKTKGYHGGKKSKRSLKNRSRKNQHLATQRKKTHATKRR